MLSLNVCPIFKFNFLIKILWTFFFKIYFSNLSLEFNISQVIYFLKLNVWIFKERLMREKFLFNVYARKFWEG